MKYSVGYQEEDDIPVTPFIIVPRYELHERFTQPNASFGVEYT